MGMQLNENLLEIISANLSQGMYVLQDSQTIFLNQNFATVFGFESQEDLLNRDMFKDIYPDSMSIDLFKSMHDQVLLEGTQKVSWAQPSLKLDGTPFWLEIEIRQVNINGKIAILGTFVDQTDCQIMAEAMVVSQQTLRRLLDAMEDRVYVVNDKFKILYANRKMRETSYGDPDNDPCHWVCQGATTPCESCSIDEVFSSGKPVHKEYYNEKLRSWYSSIEIPIRMPGLEGPAKLAVARNITARKETEQRVRALTHRLITAQEDERTTLSRELHDDLGQRLNAAKISIETLADDLKGMPIELRNRVDALTEILQGSIQSVRHLSAGLRPPSLEKLGLVEALRDLCHRFTSLHQLNINFKSAGFKELKLDKDTEINLYRIAQEALNNMAKHAKASEGSVRLIASHPTLRLRISDNGTGFDQQTYESMSPTNPHLGLLGMAERIDLLNGKFVVNSSPGSGTVIIAEVPFSQK